MEQFKAPSPLSLTGNPADNWHSWEQSFRRYIAASGEKEEQVKIDILLHTIGEDALEVYNTLTVRAEGDELTMEDVFQAFKDYCSAQKNVVFERYQHWSHQMTAEHLHIKEEPEMFSEGQEENQLCVQQETNSAACPVKYEDEEEKPQSSQLHWRQLTEITMKEEPSTCTLDEFMKRQSVGINSKGPETAQNPDPSSLVLQCPDGTETDSTQTEDSGEDDDDEDEDFWQKPLSESETEADFTRKKRKISDSSKNTKIGYKASKTQISSFQQICSKKKVQVKMTSECVGGKKASLSVASQLNIHTGEKLFKCDVCSKCFSQKSYLKLHMRTHTGEKPFKCDVCRKCFNYISNLKTHMRIHTEEKPFECDVCRKCFNCTTNLKAHMRRHTGEKPFKCDVCNKSFTTKSQLKEHMTIHTGEKPFKCNVCRKGFITNSLLKRHMRIHTGEKPFKCDVCSKCFNCTTNLKEHIRIHTGEKPFKCNVCRKCYHKKCNLKVHMKIHTVEKRFKCVVCGKCFTHKDKLQSHLIIHKEEKPVKANGKVHN